VLLWMSAIIILTVHMIAAACVIRPKSNVAGTLLDMCQPSSFAIRELQASHLQPSWAMRPHQSNHAALVGRLPMLS